MINKNAVTLENCYRLYLSGMATVLQDGKVKRFEREEKPRKEAYYEGIGKEDGILVEKENAFDYALKRCLYGTAEERAEFQEMLEEWYFSGNWILREEF